MDRIIRTQEYLGSILKNNLTGSRTKAVGLTLAQLTGNYCHSDFESAVMGYGIHFDGYVHVSLDEDLICHTAACAGWRERLARQFNISSSNISIVRAAKPKSLLTNTVTKGFAIAHESLAAKNSFGTLGGFIYPRFAGDSYRILSNNHVLGDTNRGAVGDTICAITNTVYKIAVLEKFVKLYGGGTPNFLDIAVARLDGYEPTHRPVLALAKGVVKNEGVTKFGAKTGYTVGKVVSNKYKIAIDYDGESALFENQLMLVSTIPGQQFSDGGDSGSMVKSTNGDFIGLLFAGNKQQTFANPSELVIQQLTKWGYI